ncbi:MAG: BatD family protein, partial [Flavobacteriales bacterium]|nr:BatD family protein [Flavobacteriales bacterium]
MSIAQQFTASVSKNPVNVGERFQLTFELQSNGSNFQGPDLHYFNVLGGPNMGSSMSNVNGHVTNSTTYSYILTAKKQGNIKIAGARVNTGGKTFQAKSIVLSVRKSGNQKQQSN